VASYLDFDDNLRQPNRETLSYWILAGEGLHGHRSEITFKREDMPHIDLSVVEYLMDDMEKKHQELQAFRLNRSSLVESIEMKERCTLATIIGFAHRITSAFPSAK
jgi:hypothetical protein